jgi:hypothetical protein
MPLVSPATFVRSASGALILGVVALGAMTFRAISEGNEELEASDRAFHRGNLTDAVLHARRAATAYAPGAPHTRSALERLRAVAVGSEAAGDPETAKLAWGAVRAAALETRHVTIPYATELREANERLERLAARPSSPSEPARHAKALESVPGPSAWASALLVSGFVMAVLGLLFVAARGLTRDGRLVWPKLGYGLGVFAAGALLWAIAVYRA